MTTCFNKNDLLKSLQLGRVELKHILKASFESRRVQSAEVPKIMVSQHKFAYRPKHNDANDDDDVFNDNNKTECTYLLRVCGLYSAVLFDSCASLHTSHYVRG